MKRYEYYRETASPFLKEVPSHWEDTRIGRGYAEKSIGNNDGEQLLSVFLNRGVVSYTDTDMKQVHKPSEDMSSYQLVEPGDFVLNNQQAWRGSVGVSSYRGIVSPAYIVMTPIMDNNPRFMNYMLRETACTAQFVLASKGVGSIQRILSPIKLKSSIMVLPPRAEQDQIVRYLDWQVSKINRLIAAKRKEIERIQEHLDKSIEIMFDEIASSSNDSIPLGRHITSIESGTSVNSIMGTADNDSIGVLSTSCVYGNNFDLSQNKRVAPSDYGRVSCPVKKNTLIISRMNAPSLVGACGFSEKDDTRVYLPDRLWQVRFDNVLMPEYAWRYLSTKRIKSWFATIATGTSSSMKNITKPQLKSIQIPFPSLEKQAETVRRIKTLCDKCNAACHVFEESIMHLIDLRTRLISDAVTGQIDVRGIKVPDVEYTYTETREEELEETEEN